jgi:hypothetical protein
VHFDHDGVIDMGVVLEETVEFQTAFGEESHFETGDASETPAGVGNGLHKSALFGADGLELFFVSEDVGLVAGGAAEVSGGRNSGAMAGSAGVTGSGAPVAAWRAALRASFFCLRSTARRWERSVMVFLLLQKCKRPAQRKNSAGPDLN